MFQRLGSERMGPVFVHAGFRTSSTYALHCITCEDPFVRIYEPLHEGFSTTPEFSPRPIESSAIFGPLELPLGGIASFRKSFSTERLFLKENENHTALETYITGLLEQAAKIGVRPIIKEVRSQGRIAWMKKKFGGVHIGLIRHPREQFRSYLWNARHSNWYFLAQTCQMFSFNAMPNASNWTRKFIDIPIYTDDYFSNESMFYQRISRTLHVNDLYFMFMYLWYWNTMRTLNESDICLELPLADEQSLNKNLEKYNIKIKVSDFKTTKAINDDFFSKSSEDIEILALNCLKNDIGNIEIFSINRDFIQKETDSFIDAMIDRSREYSPLGGAGAFRRPAIRSLQLAESMIVNQTTGSSANFVSYGHRLDTDPDSLSRYGAASLYLSHGATLESDSSGSYQFIKFVSNTKGLVCFGPHISIPAGTYELRFDVEVTPKPDIVKRYNTYIEVIANRGTQRLSPLIAYDTVGHTTLILHFSTEEKAIFVEPRIYSEACAIKVYGMMIKSRDPAEISYQA